MRCLPLWGFAILMFTAELSGQDELVLGVHTEEPAPSIGAVLADAAPDGAAIRVESYASAEALREQLRAGAIDFALLEETGRREPGIAVVADIYPSVLHILYRGEAVPGNLGDLLRGGAIWAGPPGSIGHTVAVALARDFGVAADEVNLLADAWTVDPDLYFIFGGILAPDALSRLGGFQLYSLGDPATLMHGSVVEGIALRYLNLRPFILPAQLYPALSDDAALTLSVSSLLVAREGLDEQISYDMAAAVEELLPAIAAIYPLAGMPQLAAGAQRARALPLHAGAQRYRQRDLPGFLERNAELLGLAATLIFAVGSGLVAWRRQRRQSRKDKLDAYYRKLLDYRTDLSQSGCDQASLAASVRSTQADVLSQVMGERIDADGALLAFLSLSNQILSEAERD